MVVRSGIKINSWLILLPFYCCLVRLLSHSFWIFSNPRLQTEPFYLEFSGSYILFNLRFSRSVLLPGVQQQLIYYIISFLLCQQLFYFFAFSFFRRSVCRISYGGVNYTISFLKCQGICVTFLNNFLQPQNMLFYLNKPYILWLQKIACSLWNIFSQLIFLIFHIIHAIRTFLFFK